MNIAIDLIIVLIMAATIITAVKRGFIVSLFSLVSLIVAFVVALAFCEPLGEYFNDAFVYSYVEPHVADLIDSEGIEKIESDAVGAMLDNLPEEIHKAIDVLNIDVEKLIGDIVIAPENIAEILAVKISGLVSKALAFIVLFLAALIILKVVCFVLNALSKLPVLKGINKTFGLLFGIAEAVALGMVIAKAALVICTLIGTAEGDTELLNTIDKTVIARIMLAICPW